MRARQRLGISPVISSTILIAITVTLGLSLWSFVNSQVNTSTESFASATTDYVNKVSERYVIVSMALGYQDPSLSTCTNVSKCVTIWVYNYSERDVKVTNVHFSDSKDNQFDVEIKDTVLKSKTLGTVTVDLSGGTIQPFSGDGKTVYYATIITDGGATKLYYQTDK
jgi:FlaG/FlaF family flagellin (archaellin)